MTSSSLMKSTRLSPVVEEILYPALEDFKLDIMIGEGPAARSIKIDLPHFTLVGATTRAGSLTKPLQDRFGIRAQLQYYSPEDLTTIVLRSMHLLNMPADKGAAGEIARRSRGTPRIANRNFDVFVIFLKSVIKANCPSRSQKTLLRCWKLTQSA